MFALQFMDLFSCFYVVVTDRAELFLMFLRSSNPFQLLDLVLVEPFGNFTNVLLQLKQFLVSHIIGIDVNSTLIMHAHHHIS